MTLTSTVKLLRRFNLGNYEHVEGVVEIVVAQGDEQAAFGHLAGILTVENLTTPRAVTIDAPVRAEVKATPAAAETVQAPRRGRPPKAKEEPAPAEPALAADPFAAEEPPAPAVDPFADDTPAPAPFDPAAATKALVAACAADPTKQQTLLAWLHGTAKKQRIRDLTPDELQACVQAVIG
jgi:hypothetical protein